MVHLILTVMAIALTSALAVVSINYLPWHLKPAADIAESVRDSLGKVDGAYQTLAQANDGAGPDPTSADPADAFQALFVSGPLRFTPAAPAGYAWGYYKYTDTVTPGSKYDGLHFICLAAGPSVGSNKALEMGLKRATAVFSSEQVTLNTSCGATSSTSSFSTAPVLTMFLVPAPLNTL